ncbi:17750_t:CDS:2, partial [Acaulospora morrowiae]
MEKVDVSPSSIRHIIGKNGDNIKDIETRSGATCIVQENQVIITGSDDERHIARNLLQNCIENSIVVYHHPDNAVVALRPPLNELKSLLFTRYEGIVSISNINKPYFVLDEGERMKRKNDDDDHISLKSLANRSFIAPKEDRVLILLIAEQLMEEVTKSQIESLSFKVRANIGKQLFYPANKGESHLPSSILLSELLEYKIGYKRDIKTTFTNFLPESLVKSVEQRLEEVGYREYNDVSEVPRASVHLLDTENKRRFTISIEVMPDNCLKILKYRPANKKHLFVSFARQKSVPDFRLKFFSKGPHEELVTPKISNFINNAIYNPSKKNIKFPKNTSYRVSTVRVKFKRKFYDDTNKTGIKVTISEIFEDGTKYMQVTATSLDLHEVLNNNKDIEECKEKMRLFINEMNNIVQNI